MSFLGQKQQQAKPPDKGSFPLDHEGACKSFKEKYLACLKTHRYDNNACREVSKEYLECRMNSNLMAREDFVKLGYKDLVNAPQQTDPPGKPEAAGQ